MDILAIIQFGFCLLATCDPKSEDGVTTVQPSKINPKFNHLFVNSTENEADNEVDSKHMRLRRNASMVIEQTDISRGARPTVMRQDGERCKFNDDCLSECCVSRNNDFERVCAPLSLSGKRCEIGQIKGGYYPDFCPCKAGNMFCLDERIGVKSSTPRKVCSR